MPALIAILVNALRILFMSRIGLIIVSALAWLGLSFGTKKVAIQPAIDALTSYMNFGGGGSLAAAAIAYMGVLRFDTAVSMIISAYLTRNGVKAARVVLLRRSGGA